MQFNNKQSKKSSKGIGHQADRLLAWTANPQAKVEAGKPYLTERDGILSLQFNDCSTQSEMSIDDPDELVIPYTRAIMNFLLLEPSPRHIAMIGLGGGSLAKYCYRHLPRTDITVVEINREVIALRNEFAIPADDARFRVLLDDGAAWLRDTASRPDVLIVDGFDTDGLPDQLCSQRFYDDCFASLADNGIMVANLWRGYPQHNEYLARIRNSFAGKLVIVEAEDNLNNIVLAVKKPVFPPSASAIRHHAKSLRLSHPLNFQAKANVLIRALSASAV